MFRLYDISMPIFEGMPVYKNKPEKQPKVEVLQDFTAASAYESRIHMDAHTGTHVDAPLHMIPGGETFESISLERLVGRCRVLDLTHVTDGISKEDLERHYPVAGEFLLLKTLNSQENGFMPEFVYLTEDGAKYLAELGIRGVGIDALGVERSQAGHPTHKALFGSNVIIIEGLRLGEVEPGDYLLVAAPLKMVGTEAAPARVLLIEGLAL